MAHLARPRPVPYLLGSALLVTLTACGASVTQDAGTGPTGPATTPAGSSTPMTPRGQSGSLVLTRGGGVAGVRDRLEVRPDGTYTVTRKGQAPVTRRLSEGERTALLAALATADLPRLAQQPAASAPGSEVGRFRYTISAEGATLSVSEATVPAQLRPLLQATEGLFSAPAPTP